MVKLPVILIMDLFVPFLSNNMKYYNQIKEFEILHFFYLKIVTLVALVVVTIYVIYIFSKYTMNQVDGIMDEAKDRKPLEKCVNILLAKAILIPLFNSLMNVAISHIINEIFNFDNFGFNLIFGIIDTLLILLWRVSFQKYH